ncbi:hypothetical protein C5167_016508 [Papaver somniferum]|nr:hypothetical protein C5167_016508 [Papaver somniferum]
MSFTFVVELMDCSGNVGFWNRSKLDLCFERNIVELVTTVRINKHGEDKLVWDLEPSGAYSGARCVFTIGISQEELEDREASLTIRWT